MQASSEVWHTVSLGLKTRAGRRRSNGLRGLSILNMHGMELARGQYQGSKAAAVAAASGGWRRQRGSVPSRWECGWPVSHALRRLSLLGGFEPGSAQHSLAGFGSRSAGCQQVGQLSSRVAGLLPVTGIKCSCCLICTFGLATAKPAVHAGRRQKNAGRTPLFTADCFEPFLFCRCNWLVGPHAPQPSS